jgi:siroheme synthase (precorrin-2 oxidase/ferrochelatase)
VESAQKEHQDRLEDIKAASEEKVMAVNEEL